MVYKIEGSPQSSDDEEVDTYNHPRQPIATNDQSFIIDSIQPSVSTPQHLNSPLQEFQISPIPAKRIRTRGVRTRGGRGGGQIGSTRAPHRIQVESQSNNTNQNDTSDSSDNVEVDSDTDNIRNVDLFEWNDTPRSLRQHQFLGTPGVKIRPEDITSHLECLMLFLSDNVISNIVEYTNSYPATMQSLPEIRRRMDESSRSLFNLWKPIDKDELWVFISILLLQGIINKPTNDMYWSKDPFLSTPIFSRLMRRD